MKRHTGYLMRLIAALALALLPLGGVAPPVGAADRWPPGAQAAYEREVATIERVIAAHLHRPLGLRPDVTLNLVNKKVLSDGKLSEVYAWADGDPSRCTIYFNPIMEQLHGRDRSVVVAHEVYHCFEDDLNPYTSPWIAEGQADWVGEAVAGPAHYDVFRSWERYLYHPEIRLFARSYDAIGFYAHLDESCISPWRILDAMLLAARGGDRGAYDAATGQCSGGTAAPFLDSWASGLFRDPSRGHDWDTTGPAMPPRSAVNPVPREIALANGQSPPPLAALPFTNGIYTLDASADIVQVDASGHARLSDGRVDQILQGHANFCTRAGGCACSPGSVYQGTPPTPLAARADLALTGGPDGAKVGLTGRSLDDFCTKKPAPLPAGPGGPLPADPCTLFRRGDVVPFLSAGIPFAIQSTGNSYGGGSFLCTHTVSYVGKHPVPDRTDHFAFGTAFRSDQMLASGDYKPFPGYGERSLLHRHVDDSEDLAELLVRRGSIWFVVSVEYTYPDAQAHAHSGRSALAACQVLTRKVLSRW